MPASSGSRTNEEWTNKAFHKVFVPLMVRVGDEWEQGIISVAQEHMVSEFVKQRIVQFFRVFPVQPFSLGSE